MSTQLTGEITAVLAEIAPELAGLPVDPETDLRDQFDLDSMDLLNFAVALSKRYGIDIPEADYPQLVTVVSCAAYLERAAKAPRA